MFQSKPFVSRDAIYLLLMVAEARGMHTAALRHSLAKLSVETEISPRELVLIAKKCGIEVHCKKPLMEDLAKYEKYFPLVLQDQSGGTLLLTAIPPAPIGKTATFCIANGPDLGEEIFSQTQMTNWSPTWVLFASRHVEDSLRSGKPFGLSWFWHQILKQKPLLFCILPALICAHVLALALPVFFQTISDKVLVHHTLNTLDVLSVAVVAAILGQLFFNYLREYFIAVLSLRISVLLADISFRQLLSLPLSYFTSHPAGTIANNIYKGEEVSEFAVNGLAEFFIATTGLALFGGLLFYYSPQLAAIVAIFSALSFIIIYCFLLKFKNLLDEILQYEGERKALLTETITGIHTVKSAALERSRLFPWLRATHNFGLKIFGFNVAKGKLQAVIEFLDSLGGVTVLYFGVKSVIQNQSQSALGDQLTLGELIAFRMVSEQVSQSVKILAKLSHEFLHAKVNARLVANVMDQAKEQLSGKKFLPTSDSGNIEFNDVVFRFGPGGREILNRVSFTIPQGQFIGIVGPSGSGKSTIAKLLQGLYYPSSGGITLGGTLVNGIDVEVLRTSVGCVPQDSFLFSGTIAENVAITEQGDIDQRKLMAALTSANCLDFINDLPDGPMALVSENGANFSGGQRQRLALARMFYANPRILVLDESTSALDRAAEKTVVENIRKSRCDTTTIFITHRVDNLIKADSILVMNAGVLHAHGTYGELKHPNSGNELFRKLLNAEQTGGS